MTKYVVIHNQLTVLNDLLQWIWRIELIKTAHVAFCTLRCFIHKPAALFMTYCKISLMSVISRDTPTPSYIPMCRNKLNFDKLLHACFLILFFEGCLSTLENFQLVKVILHEVSTCEWYQLIMLMRGFHYTEVLDF